MRGRSTRFRGRSGTCWWHGAPRRRKSGWRRLPTNARESKRIRKTVSSYVKLCTYININSRSRNKFKDCMFNMLPWFIKLVILICGFRNISILLICLNLPQSDKRFPVLNKLWDISITFKVINWMVWTLCFTNTKLSTLFSFFKHVFQKMFKFAGMMGF